MPKPPSIARFEHLYWASVIVGLINTGLAWGASRATFAANPILAQVTWLLPVMQVVGIAINVTVWFFIARRPTVVAKWVMVVFAAISAFALVWALGMVAMGRASIGTQAMLGTVANLLYIGAAVMLFRPDARLWLGEGLDEDDLDLDMGGPRT